MQAVILAAGNSSRFYPFSDFGHKSMVPLLGKPILVSTILSLKKAGINSIVIVCNSDEIPNKIGDGSLLGVSIIYKKQDSAEGMGHALLQAEDVLENRFFVLNAARVDAHEFIDKMSQKQKDNEIVLLGKYDNELKRYGVVEYENDRVLSITEKPKDNQKSDVRLIGIYLLNKLFLQTLKQISLSHYHFEEALDAYAKKNLPAGGAKILLINKSTISLKYSWDLLSIKDYLLSQVQNFKAENVVVEENVTISGSVFFEEGAKVMSGAVIKGPAYIGKNVIIGNHALLRNGVDVEEGSLIGANLEVKNSIILNNVDTHSGFIGDSIIGHDTKIAANFCTTNARLDRGEISSIVKNKKTNTGLSKLGVIIGSNCNIGSGVTTMPGVIIGNNVVVGPSTTIMKNVEDNVRYYTEFKETVEKASQSKVKK